MSGTETDATVLALLKGAGPCPICASALPEWCEHRRRARWAVQGTCGPECGDCGAVINLRMPHTCMVEETHERVESAERTAAWGDERERYGRDREARAIVAWLRHRASSPGVSFSQARSWIGIADSIERRDHDR